MEENIENTEPAPESTPPAPDPAPEQAPEEPKQEVSQDAKNMAMLCHLLGLLTNFIGPLILWLVKKDDDPFIDKQGKEALNFQITVAIAIAVLGVTCIALWLIPVVYVLDLVFSIIACVKSSKGEDYRYPVSIRLVK
jgi:hypothetical protein